MACLRRFFSTISRDFAFICKSLSSSSLCSAFSSCSFLIFSCTFRLCSSCDFRKSSKLHGLQPAEPARCNFSFFLISGLNVHSCISADSISFARSAFFNSYNSFVFSNRSSCSLTIVVLFCRCYYGLPARSNTSSTADVYSSSLSLRSSSSGTLGSDELIRSIFRTLTSRFYCSGGYSRSYRMRSR